MAAASLMTISCSSDFSKNDQNVIEMKLVECGSSANEIRVCVATDGLMRAPATNENCKKNEKALCWNKVGPAGTSSLVVVSTLAAGSNICLYGGSKIDAGVDDNKNGLLEMAEIDGQAYVCNGTPGVNGANGENGENGENGQNGFNGQNGLNGHNAVIKTTGFAANTDAHCPYGGVILEVGTDLNDNSLLETNEIIASQTQYICNGKNGLNSLVFIVDEAAGANCLNGGKAINIGLDDNEDNILQPAEIDQTSFVCNGATGAAGANGAAGVSALIRQEDAGASCTYGGRTILSGIDTNQNNYLDAAEVISSGNICNGAPGLPGLSTLFIMSAESAGANCASGGTRLESGLDTNSNGALEVAEITQRRYVCNGAEATNSISSQAIRVTNAAWGGVCSRGGIKIETGSDLNGNGLLEDAEKQREQYVCSLYVTQIAAGSGHTCALISDRTVRCWGKNNSGQLGLGTTGSSVANPSMISGLNNVFQISAGTEHSCVLVYENGNSVAKCWGQNGSGQLGDGTNVDKATPTLVTGLSNIKQIVAGYHHSCAVLEDGTAKCWGSNSYNQLNSGTSGDSNVPVPFTGVTNIRQMALGEYHTYAVTNNNLAYRVGRELVPYSQDLSPAYLNFDNKTVLTNVAQIAAGHMHDCARLIDGKVYCWGQNFYGQAGPWTSGSLSDPDIQRNAYLVAENAQDISLGRLHSCAITDNGNAKCWGNNNYGQLGNGTTNGNVNDTATSVNSIHDGMQISAGLYYTCLVLKKTGTAACFGANDSYQLGDTNLTASSSPVTIPWSFQ